MSATVEVATRFGTVRGTVEDGVARFLGVPYAAAPFGEHRFRPAQPHPGWSGVRDALEMGATAPKPPYPRVFRDLLPEPVVEGTECLNVNVWAPDGASAAPVMVFVHGGAFVNGSNAVPVYDGTAFARDGVVLVSVNYRLGAEGFLLLPGGTPNLGLLDQVAALEWVRDTITAFGGDPGQVTVFGESAGAMSIAALLAMPAAQGLVHRAILQSGAGQHAMSAESAAMITRLFAEQVGTAPEDLAGVAPERLLEAQQELSRELRTGPDPRRFGDAAVNAMLVHPVIDGDVLPALPLERIAAGSAADVEVMVGTTRDEMRIFLVASGAMDLVNDAALAGVAAFYRLPDGAVERYRVARPEASPGQVVGDLTGDWFFRIPAVRLAEAHGRAWVYEFDWPVPVLEGRLGACHASELGFVFDTLPAAAVLNGADAPQELADAVHGAWVAFASTGDPGWERYGETRAVRRFATTVETVPDPRGDLRELWSGIR